MPRLVALPLLALLLAIMLLAGGVDRRFLGRPGTNRTARYQLSVRRLANRPLGVAYENVLLGYVNRQDQRAIREHAWALWQGITAPSRSTWNGQVLPIFDTWFSATEVFDDRAAGRDVDTPDRRFTRQLESPRQSGHSPEAPGGQSAAVMSFVKLNRDAAHFIWDNQYYLRKHVKRPRPVLRSPGRAALPAPDQPLPARRDHAQDRLLARQAGRQSPDRPRPDGASLLGPADTAWPIAACPCTPTGRIAWPSTLARYPLGSLQPVNCNETAKSAPLRRPTRHRPRPLLHLPAQRRC